MGRKRQLPSPIAGVNHYKKIFLFQANLIWINATYSYIHILAMHGAASRPQVSAKELTTHADLTVETGRVSMRLIKMAALAAGMSMIAGVALAQNAQAPAQQPAAQAPAATAQVPAPPPGYGPYAGGPYGYGPYGYDDDDYYGRGRGYGRGYGRGNGRGHMNGTFSFGGGGDGDWLGDGWGDNFWNGDRGRRGYGRRSWGPWDW
jgi:uncharacterized membrane protein YgcG